MPYHRRYFSPDGGQELKADQSLFDVPNWRELLLASSKLSEADFFYNIQAGNVPGHKIVFLQNYNNSVGVINVKQGFRNLPGFVTRFSSATQLYLSSSDSGDTSVLALVTGLDGDFNELTSTMTLTGNTQVALNDLFIRVKQVNIIGSTQPLGDIYLAELDGTISGGVPQDNSKIQVKIENGKNLGHTGMITVPAGHTFFNTIQAQHLGKSVSASLSLNVVPLGGLVVEIFEYDVFEAQTDFKVPFTPTGEKVDITWYLTPRDTQPTKLTTATAFIQVENSYLGANECLNMMGMVL